MSVPSHPLPQRIQEPSLTGGGTCQRLLVALSVLAAEVKAVGGVHLDLLTSPMNSGTWNRQPVSTVAGFVPALERLPCRPFCMGNGQDHGSRQFGQRVPSWKDTTQSVPSSRNSLIADEGLRNVDLIVVVISMNRSCSPSRRSTELRLL